MVHSNLSSAVPSGISVESIKSFTIALDENATGEENMGIVPNP
jgi:hypothetical protein